MSHPLTEAVKAKDDQANYKPDEVFAKDHFLYLIVGRKRSGKSTLALNLLDTPQNKGGFKKKFDFIWLISPTAERDPKMQELVKELNQEGQFYNTFNNEIQHEIMEKIQAINDQWKKKKQKPNHLVIYDDVLALLPSNRKKGQYFNLFMTNQRHLRSSALILAQRLNELNTLIRSQTDIISYFRQDNPKEDKLFSEAYGIPLEILHEVVDEPHGFLTVSFLHDKPKLYKKFDEFEFNKA